MMNHECLFKKLCRSAILISILICSQVYAQQIHNRTNTRPKTVEECASLLQQLLNEYNNLAIQSHKVGASERIINDLQPTLNSQAMVPERRDYGLCMQKVTHLIDYMSRMRSIMRETQAEQLREKQRRKEKRRLVKEQQLKEERRQEPEALYQRQEYEVPPGECIETNNGSVICSGSADYCYESQTGLVACGSRADYCQESMKGQIACGGLADYCQESMKGQIACGGRADYCQEGMKGQVACGGLADYCIENMNGQVACGGRAGQ